LNRVPVLSVGHTTRGSAAPERHEQSNAVSVDEHTVDMRTELRRSHIAVPHHERAAESWIARVRDAHRPDARARHLPFMFMARRGGDPRVPWRSSVLSEAVQKRAKRWVCRLCGAELDVDADHVPNVIVSVEDGERVLVVDGTAIHRCCADGAR
jgi:hypothetical protein